MFFHNLKYSFKTLFGQKALIFWTFIFPILLGTFFNMAFSNIEKKETFKAFDIAIIDNDEFNNNEIYKEAFTTLSDDSNKDKLFNIKYTSLDDAKELLSDTKIVGYLLMSESNPKVVVSSNGTNETIFRDVVEEISSTSKMITNISENEVKKEISKGNYAIDYSTISNRVKDIINNSNPNIKDITSNNLSYTMIEFYTLIAMACLYGGMLGKASLDNNLANMSGKGKRVSISPMKKSTAIFSSVLASYITSLIGIALLFVYTIFVLKVDYGSNLPLIILLGMVGSLAGVTLGIAIDTVLKVSDSVKMGAILAISMLGCFLSGMMGITMKYVVDKNIPILNKINPASMITDGFYSLYYYNTLDRYKFNIICLLIFSGIMIIISSISLRGQKYDSI